MSEYHPLPAQRLAGAVGVARLTPPKSVTLMSPALDVMTDLRTIEAGTTEPNETMECANTHMKERGIRSLLVLNQDKILVGMITAADILGEKPLRFIQERRMKHNEILVADIMTPLDRLEAIPIEQVRHGKVANVIASLRNAGRQHSLVIESDPEGNLEVCGIFSLTQIEKQLGAAILPIEVARTFTEIEEALIAS